MPIKRDHVESWLTTQAPGETLIAFTPAVTASPGSFNVGTHSSSPSITVTPGSSSDDGRRTDLARFLGFEQDQRVGYLVENVFYALTDHQLLIGSRSAFRDRPKDLLATAPREQVKVHWFDEEPGGIQSRHFVVDLGDGRYRSDKIILTLRGRPQKVGNLSTDFLTALGEQALEA